MEMNNEKRERSALYPMMSVDECFNMIETIDKIGGRMYSKYSIAQAVGMSEKTNSFRARISTLKQYGLLTGAQDTYKLTSLANQYLYPTEDSQKREVKVECFSSVPLYKKILDKYVDQALPSDEKLANMLLGNDFGLTRNTKDNAAKYFVESLTQLGLLINGVIVLGENQDTKDDKEQQIPIASAEIIETNMQNNVVEKTLVSHDFVFEIPTLSGGVAKVTIPKNSTKKDLDFIQMYIENMLPVFLDNLRSE